MQISEVLACENGFPATEVIYVKMEQILTQCNSAISPPQRMLLISVLAKLSLNLSN